MTNDRDMITHHSRTRRKKSSIRQWLDDVVMSALGAVKHDHPDLSLKDRWALRMIRKRIAGSISNGLERKLESHGIKFPDDESEKWDSPQKEGS